MFKVAIIGFGPRGLVALERVRAHLRNHPFTSEIDIFDPTPSTGWGVHSPGLSPYLRLNTVAAQLTGYTDPVMVADGAPVTPGPTFHQWVLAKNIPLTEYGHSRTPEGDDFLPRSVIGDYLQEVAEMLTRDADRTTVTLRRQAVDAIIPTDNEAAVVVTENGHTGTIYDLVIIATGHGVRPTDSDELLHVLGGQRVLLRGMGLTAMDMVAELTLGRGGAFSRDAAGALNYTPSGNEPTIILSSRSGQLPAARPTIDLAGPSHSSDLFTDADALLTQHLHATNDPHTAGRALILDGLDGALTADELARVERKTAGPTKWNSHEDFIAVTIDDAEWDLEHARRGIPGSRYKRALEALRTNREYLRRAVEELDDQARERFFAATPDLINRLVIGPQKERIEELLALHRAGIVEFGPGPEPEVVNTPHGLELRSRWLRTPTTVPIDRIIEARVPAPTQSLTAAGRLQGCRLYTAEGPTRVCVVGPPAEGQSYYNHYVPSPAVPSRAHRELDSVLDALLADNAAEAVAT